MTFPNHYSIATGLYPSEHGIVDNTFPDARRENWYSLYDRDAVGDGRWYGGEPIWVTAEKHGVTSAAFFFVGTEAPIQGISPSHWRRFDGSIPGERRVAQALEWLALPEPERPRLVTLYFEDVDDASHDHGPGSPESLAAVRRVDGYLQQLRDGLARLGIDERTYLVVVSDHGQATLREDAAPFMLSRHVTLSGMRVEEHTSYAALYLDDPDPGRAAALRDTINANWAHGRAWLRAQAPAHWRVGDDGRYADVYAVADPGYAVVSTPERYVKPGNHGYDPSAEAMHGIFLARGPGLPAGVVLDEIASVDVYPLLTRMLGLPLPAGYAIQHDDLRRLLK